MQLARQNAALIADPDLIYPQMRLQVARTVYVKKRTGDNGIETPEYRFGTEKRVSFGILESGEAFANCAMYGSEGEVICLIRDKEPQGEKRWQTGKKQNRRSCLMYKRILTVRFLIWHFMNMKLRMGGSCICSLMSISLMIS